MLSFDNEARLAERRFYEEKLSDDDEFREMKPQNNTLINSDLHQAYTIHFKTGVSFYEFGEFALLGKHIV